MSSINPLGIVLLLLGVLIVALAGRFIERKGVKNVVKLTGLFVAMGGTLLAICG